VIITTGRVGLLELWEHIKLYRIRSFASLKVWVVRAYGYTKPLAIRCSVIARDGVVFVCQKLRGTFTIILKTDKEAYLQRIKDATEREIKQGDILTAKLELSNARKANNKLRDKIKSVGK